MVISKLVGCESTLNYLTLNFVHKLLKISIFLLAFQRYVLAKSDFVFLNDCFVKDMLLVSLLKILVKLFAKFLAILVKVLEVADDFMFFKGIFFKHTFEGTFG